MQDWHLPSLDRLWRALSAAKAPADRLALLRSIVRLNGGRVDIGQQNDFLLSDAEYELLPRFGLAKSGKNTLRLVEEPDRNTLVGLNAALIPDLGSRKLAMRDGPDAILLRHSSHLDYTATAQKAAVQALATMPAGAGLLAGLPTGMGKSLLFQLAPLLNRTSKRRAAVVVITPTIALALDHERTLQAMPGLTGSRALTGDCSEDETSAILAGFRRGEVPVLLLSPEKALSRRVRSELAASAHSQTQYSDLVGQLTHVFVDEAHIIEAWGRYFRPDFQKLPSLLVELRQANADIRAVLLSATLPPSAKRLLRAEWGEAGPWLEVHAGTARYEHDIVIASYDSASARAADLEFVIDRAPRPAIVYTTEVEDAERLHDRLRQQCGYRRTALFTGDTLADDRKTIVKQWSDDHLDLVVATSAFGLGIDKPGVRSVIHACLPETAARYYQEIGRASRDGGQGLAVCLFTHSEHGNDLSSAARIASHGWIGRELAEKRWTELLAKSTVVGRSGAREVRRFDVDTVRQGLANRSSDYNVDWNVMLLLLMQRAGAVELVVDVQTSDPTGKKTVDAVVLDARLLGHHSEKAWDQVFSLRDKEQVEAREDYRKFAAIMQAPMRDCIISQVFGVIDPDHYAPPCGRCPSCRHQAVSPPAEVRTTNPFPVWEQEGAPISKYGRGILLLEMADATLVNPLNAVLGTLGQAGFQQYIVPEILVRRVAEHLKAVEETLGLALAIEDVVREGFQAHRLNSVLILPADDDVAERAVAWAQNWSARYPELTLLVCCDPRRMIDGRRLSQFLSDHAPLRTPFA